MVARSEGSGRRSPCSRSTTGGSCRTAGSRGKRGRSSSQERSRSRSGRWSSGTSSNRPRTEGSSTGGSGWRTAGGARATTSSWWRRNESPGERGGRDKSISGDAGAFLRDLQKQFSQTYSGIYSEYQESISGPINKHVRYDSISVQTVSPVLSTKFIEKVINVVVMSAVLSVILVFAFFRAIPPSIAVLTGAAADIVIALGAMGLFHIPLTLPSFAALLMLVGYSVDTDVLLSTRVLKVKEGTIISRVYSAMKTGFMMSITTLVAVTVALIISVYFGVTDSITQIMTVLLIGLVVDLINTWIQNAGILRWYLDKNG